MNIAHRVAYAETGATGQGVTETRDKKSGAEMVAVWDYVSITRVIPPFGDQHHLVSLDFRRLCLGKVFPSRFLLSGRSRGLSRASVFPVAAFAFD